VAAPASANPNPVHGTTTTLSVLGSDAAGESSLTYLWSVTSAPAGAPTPTFSANGTNAAKSNTATFYKAGSYTFQVTLTDPNGLTATSSVAVTVAHTVKSVTVSPGNVSVPNGNNQPFSATALDQFGMPLTPQPSLTWSVTNGLGTVNSSGTYTAPTSGTGVATVFTNCGSAGGSASVTVTAASVPAVPTNVSATALSQNQVTISWTEASSSVTGFYVERSSNGGKSWTVVQVPGTVTSYRDTSLGRGKTYQYRIAAFNSLGTSAWSATIIVTSPS
jgi:hypothetical protein